MTGNWKKLHSEDLHSLLFTKYYHYDQIIEEMGRPYNTYAKDKNVPILVGNPKGTKAHMEDLGEAGRVILKWILRK